MGKEAAAAIRAAGAWPGQVATLIVPADFSWSEAGQPAACEPPSEQCAAGAGPPEECVRMAASVLRSGEPAGLLLGGSTLLGAGLEWAGKLAAGTGVKVLANRYSGRFACGGGRFAALRLPYFPEAAEAALSGLKHLILVESQPPVSFFGYPGRRSDLVPEDCSVHVLARIDADGTEALRALLKECGEECGEECGVASIRPPGTAGSQQVSKPSLPAGAALTPDAIGRALAGLLPEGAIISEEAVSSGEAILRHLSCAPAFDLLPVTGGAIGQGLPVAVGAAVACPDRKVIALEADGSSMYTPQSLWTMAREKLDVIVVILANRRYRILEIEMARTGAGEISRRANEMIDISRPDLDWVKLAEGMGVQAARATTADEFMAQFAAAVKQSGPALIEAITAK
jgi:acetolactate synthase-1/2/3 large subunit